MTLDEIQKSLPNGFHDAELRSLMIDHEAQQGKLDLLILVGTPDRVTYVEREAYRPARLTLLGLQFCVIDPPEAAYPYAERGSVSIDAGPGQPSTSMRELPSLSDGVFLHWIYVSD